MGLEDGPIRYSTPVNLTMGEGSQKRSGMQEAGLVVLTNPVQLTEMFMKWDVSILLPYELNLCRSDT